MYVTNVVGCRSEFARQGGVAVNVVVRVRRRPNNAVRITCVHQYTHYVSTINRGKHIPYSWYLKNVIREFDFGKQTRDTRKVLRGAAG